MSRPLRHKKITDGATPEQQQHLDIQLAAWILPVAKASDDETFQSRRRTTLAAVNILMWRAVPKRKRERARARGMTGPASKRLEADMRWLRDEATPEQWREVADMLARNQKPDKHRVLLLQNWLAANKEKDNAAEFKKDIQPRYHELCATFGIQPLSERQLRRILTEELRLNLPRAKSW
jgi:hypothetical protein